MDEMLQNAAVNVMKKLLEHPLTIIFLEPIQLSEGDSKTSEKPTTNPIDLTSIQTHLLNREYTTPQKWIDDVECVWSNAELNYSNNVHLTTIAKECRRLFNKIKREIDALMLGTWCVELTRLRGKIMNIISSPPPKMKAYFLSQTSGHTQTQSYGLLTEREMHNFVLSSQMMNEKEQDEIVQIMLEHQPELEVKGEDITMDVTKMKLDTVYSVRDYIKNELEKNGSKYPE